MNMGVIVGYGLKVVKIKDQDIYLICRRMHGVLDFWARVLGLGPMVNLLLKSLKAWGTCGPSSVDRIWLWVYYNKIPIYPIFYLLKGDYRVSN